MPLICKLLADSRNRSCNDQNAALRCAGNTPGPMPEALPCCGCSGSFFNPQRTFYPSAFIRLPHTSSVPALPGVCPVQTGPFAAYLNSSGSSPRLHPLHHATANKHSSQPPGATCMHRGRCSPGLRRTAPVLPRILPCIPADIASGKQLSVTRTYQDRPARTSPAREQAIVSSFRKRILPSIYLFRQNVRLALLHATFMQREGPAALACLPRLPILSFSPNSLPTHGSEIYIPNRFRRRR